MLINRFCASCLIAICCTIPDVGTVFTIVPLVPSQKLSPESVLANLPSVCIYTILPWILFANPIADICASLSASTASPEDIPTTSPASIVTPLAMVSLLLRTWCFTNILRYLNMRFERLIRTIKFS